jgi:hypothetical protein
VTVRIRVIKFVEGRSHMIKMETYGEEIEAERALKNLNHERMSIIIGFKKGA